jgi:hypothetical protein
VLESLSWYKRYEGFQNSFSDYAESISNWNIQDNPIVSSTTHLLSTIYSKGRCIVTAHLIEQKVQEAYQSFLSGWDHANCLLWVDYPMKNRPDLNFQLAVEKLNKLLQCCQSCFLYVILQKIDHSIFKKWSISPAYVTCYWQCTLSSWLLLNLLTFFLNKMSEREGKSVMRYANLLQNSE